MVCQVSTNFLLLKVFENWGKVCRIVSNCGFTLYFRKCFFYLWKHFCNFLQCALHSNLILFNINFKHVLIINSDISKKLLLSVQIFFTVKVTKRLMIVLYIMFYYFYFFLMRIRNSSLYLLNEHNFISFYVRNFLRKYTEQKFVKFSIRIKLNVKTTRSFPCTMKCDFPSVARSHLIKVRSFEMFDII